MKIKIDQTLHGYSHGHQLLSSSVNLPSEVKEVLLVHSDLSGSSIDNGFKEYITGYPLSNNKYAFAKTWYADEMKRPGCVWTHTLLINFADLGKIPDLDRLVVYFSRPVINDYLSYQSTLEIDLKDTISKASITKDSVSSGIMIALYEDYMLSTLMSSDSSSIYEKTVLQIWSNQWPRLRRNFTFCTGALNIKLLEGKEFDLQIIPSRNASVFAKKSQEYILIDNNNVKGAEWLNIIYSSPKNEFRRFLWVYGSDVTGLRKYFIPLVLLYGESLKDKKSIEAIAKLLENNFYEEKEAELLKTKIFATDNIFRFEESEILKYLLTVETIPVSNVEKLNLQSRLVEAFNNNKISLEDFFEVLVTAKADRISQDVWNEVKLDEKEILYLISKDSSLLELLGEKIALLAQEPYLWQHSTELQLKIYESLNRQPCDWRAILFAALDAGSPIITKMLNQESHHKVPFIFEWQQLTNTILNQELGEHVFRDFKNDFFTFIKSNINNLSSANCCELFNYYNSNDIISINLDSVSWASIYSKVSDERLKVYASCVLLSMAFNKKTIHPETLIPKCFEDVFLFAKNAMVKEDLWHIIPVDIIGEDEPDNNPFSLFFSLFAFSPKLVSHVKNWDYCEILIRTLTNKFIKNHWPPQKYIDSLSNYEIFIRSIDYCSSFKKGARFLNGILNGISTGSIKLNKAQNVQFNKFLKN